MAGQEGKERNEGHTTFAWNISTAPRRPTIFSQMLIVLIDEVRAALKKMKRHKAPGLSGLVTEMIQATGDTGECFFWNRPTRVVPDQRPLNGRCCCLFFTGSRGSSLYNIAEWYAILECGW